MDENSPTRSKWHTEMTASPTVMKSSLLATLATMWASMSGVPKIGAGTGWSYLRCVPADITQWIGHTVGEIRLIFSHRPTPLTSPRRVTDFFPRAAMSRRC